jgi:hypothetical protein
MSDPDSWDDDDKAYLAQRGELPVDVMSVDDQRRLLDPEQNGERLLTGQLGNTGNAVEVMSTEALEAELERRRAAQPLDVDTEKLFNPEGLAGASRGAEEDDDDTSDPLEPPYDQYRKGELSAEIQRRNEAATAEDEDAETMPLSGSKEELVARLEEHDAAQEDEE